MAISPELQAQLDDFSTKLPDGKEGVAYQNLIQVIEDSPFLEQKLNDAVEGGHLTSFNLMPEGEHAGARFNDGIIELKLNTLSDPNQNMDLTHQLAHETEHSFFHEIAKQAHQDYLSEIKIIAQSTGTSHDYTEAIERGLQVNARNEALAHIAGWNAVVSAMTEKKPDLTMEDLYQASGYMGDFISREGAAPPYTYSLKEGLTINTDFTMDATLESNIDGSKQHFFYQSASDAKLGSNGDSDYTNNYGTWYVENMCRYEMHYQQNSTSPEKTILDMDRLGLSEALLERNGLDIDVGLGNRCNYYDIKDLNTTLHFDHTSSGENKHKHVSDDSIDIDNVLDKILEDLQETHEVKALHEKIGEYLYPSLEKLNVNQNHADSMVATAVQQAVDKKITADEVIHVGVNQTKNLINVFTKDTSKMASFDAIEASKNDPEKTLAAAQQQLERQPDQEFQRQQQLEHQAKEHRGPSM